MNTTALKEQLAEVETELGEIGEVVEEALNKYFQEEYEVGDVKLVKDRILVSIKLVPDEE